MTKPQQNTHLTKTKTPAAALLLLAAALLCGCTAFSDTPEAPTGDRVCTQGCGTTVTDIGKLALGASPLALTSREHLVFTLVPDSTDATGNTLLLRSFDTLTESAVASIPLKDFALDSFRPDQRLHIALSDDILLAQSPKGILLSLLDDAGTPSPLTLPPTDASSPLKVSPSGLLIPGYKANGAGNPDTYNPSLLWLSEIPGQDRHFFSISCFTKPGDPQAQTQCTTSILAYSPTSALSSDLGFECLTLSNAGFFCEKKANATFPNLTVNTDPSEDLLTSGRTSTEALFFLRSGDQTFTFSFFYKDTDIFPKNKDSFGVDLPTVTSLAVQRTSDSPTHYASLNSSQASIWLFTQDDDNRISADENWLDLNLSSLAPRALVTVDPNTLIILGEQNAFGMRLPGQKGAEQEMEKLLDPDWSGFSGQFSTSGPYVHVLTGTDLRTLRIQSSTPE